jgi:hypothetical protein
MLFANVFVSAFPFILSLFPTSRVSFSFFPFFLFPLLFFFFLFFSLSFFARQGPARARPAHQDHGPQGPDGRCGQEEGRLRFMGVVRCGVTQAFLIARLLSSLLKKCATNKQTNSLVVLPPFPEKKTKFKKEKK